MSASIEQHGRTHGIPVECVDAGSMAACRRRLDTHARRWLDATGFEARPGRVALIPDRNGRLARVLVGVDVAEPLWALAALPWQLPVGRYALAAEGVALDHALAALGWALGAYRFTRYRKAGRDPARLLVEKSVHAALLPLIDAVTQVRDLVNTPTEDLGPQQLADAVKALAKPHRAKVREWVGDALLKANFPTIHAVGRASHRAPRLIELTWGKAGDPQLVLVGKGVCFDSGGLNLKVGDGMRWMK
jgi:leucyl aminopeptidase